MQSKSQKFLISILWTKVEKWRLKNVQIKVFERPLSALDNFVACHPVIIKWLRILFINIRHKSSVHKHQAQMCISRRPRKSFSWITSVYLNQSPRLCKHLLHRHLRIFIQRRFMLKKITVFTFEQFAPNSHVNLRSLN